MYPNSTWSPTNSGHIDVTEVLVNLNQGNCLAGPPNPGKGGACELPPIHSAVIGNFRFYPEIKWRLTSWLQTFDKENIANTIKIARLFNYSLR